MYYQNILPKKVEEDSRKAKLTVDLSGAQFSTIVRGTRGVVVAKKLSIDTASAPVFAGAYVVGKPSLTFSPCVFFSLFLYFSHFPILFELCLFFVGLRVAEEIRQ